MIKRSYNHWIEEEIEYLKDNYKNKDKQELTNNLNHTWAAIKRKANFLKMKRNGLPIDEDFFKTWTPKMAYIFGFWIADGNMFEKNSSISFYNKDYNLIFTIKSILKSGYKIGKDKDNVFHSIITNKIIYDDILKLGGIPRKSLTIQFPEIPDEYLHHFIRGEFDGDGCFYIMKNGKYYYLGATFTDNIDFLTAMKNKIKEKADIDPTYLRHDKRVNQRIYELKYQNKKAIALGDYMYKDSENLRLERKFKIYNKMKKEYLEKLEIKRKYKKSDQNE